MKDITPVNAFTTPVEIIEDGDAANGTNFETTAQALTNRTHNLNLRVTDLEPFKCRAWAKVVSGGAGAPTVNDQNGFASIALQSTSSIRFTFSTAMANANYAVVVSINNQGANTNITPKNQSTGFFDVETQTPPGTVGVISGIDFSLVVFGDL
jgi:hypothetical protein